MNLNRMRRAFMAICLSMLFTCVSAFGSVATSSDEDLSPCVEALAPSEFGKKVGMAGKILGIATWELAGIPIRMLMTIAMPNGGSNVTVTGRGAISYALRLHLTDK